MITYTCDRCGNSVYAGKFMHISLDNKIIIDLCDRCLDAVKDFCKPLPICIPKTKDTDD